MSDLTFEQQRKLNLRAKRRRLAFAKLSPFAKDGTLPDPPELDGDLAPSLSPWDEEMMEALSDDWYEDKEKVPKSEKTRQLSRKYPVIPTRTSRMKSQEDGTPQLRLHATEEEDGAGNILSFDPFETHDYNAWQDETHEYEPIGNVDAHLDDSFIYTEADYVRLATIAYPRRSLVDSGKLRIGGAAHDELIDLDVRIAEDDAFGLRLAAIAWARPISRAEEAAALGVSPRTLRRREQKAA